MLRNNVRNPRQRDNMVQWLKDALIWCWWHPFRALLHRMPVARAHALGVALARAVSTLPLPLALAMRRVAPLVLGHADGAKLRAAAREGMFCFLMNEIETLLFPRLEAADMPGMAPLEGRELLDRALADGHGAILLLSHFGANQMVMPAVGFGGYTLYQVSAPATILNERLPEQRPGWIKRTREMRWEHEQRLPVVHINGLGSLVESLRCLRAGHVLAIAGDGGHVVSPVVASFFGLRVNFPAGPMLAARKTGSPVLPVFVVRGVDGRNRVCIEPPITVIHDKEQTKEAAVEQGVAEYARRLERRVREHPGHYLRYLAFREHMAQVDAVPFQAD